MGYLGVVFLRHMVLGSEKIDEPQTTRFCGGGGGMTIFPRKRECQLLKTKRDTTFQLKTKRNTILTEICEIIFVRDLFVVLVGDEKITHFGQKRFRKFQAKLWGCGILQNGGGGYLG